MTTDASMIVYDPATSTSWAASVMPLAPTFYGMTMLGSDVLVCGGVNMSVCWLHIAGVDTWLAFPSLPTILAHFRMVTMYDVPYVFGGYSTNNSTGNIFNTVYAFKSNMWNVHRPMPKALWDHSAVEVNSLEGDLALV